MTKQEARQSLIWFERSIDSTFDCLYLVLVLGVLSWKNYQYYLLSWGSGWIIITFHISPSPCLPSMNDAVAGPSAQAYSRSVPSVWQYYCPPKLQQYMPLPPKMTNLRKRTEWQRQSTTTTTLDNIGRVSPTAINVFSKNHTCQPMPTLIPTFQPLHQPQ